MGSKTSSGVNSSPIPSGEREGAKRWLCRRGHLAFNMDRVNWYAFAMAPGSDVRKARGRGLLRRFARAWKVEAGVGRVR